MSSLPLQTPQALLAPWSFLSLCQWDTTLNSPSDWTSHYLGQPPSSFGFSIEIHRWKYNEKVLWIRRIVMHQQKLTLQLSQAGCQVFIRPIGLTQPKLILSRAGKAPRYIFPLWCGAAYTWGFTVPAPQSLVVGHFPSKNATSELHKGWM